MRYTLLFLITYLIAIIASEKLYAQWVQTNGPYGKGHVLCIADCPNGKEGTYIFAGLEYGGVYRSTDNGESWSSTGLTSPTVYTLYAFRDTIFAGTECYIGTNPTVSYNFYSTDYGLTWSSFSGINAVQAITSIGTKLFAGTSNGLFVSTNGGLGWTEISKGLSSKYILSLASIDSNLYAGIQGGIFLSTNYGSSWSKLNTGFSNSSPYITSLVVSGQYLFAGTYGEGVFRSSDKGVSWTKVNTGLTAATVHELALLGTNIFAATDHYVFLSNDNGTSWTSVSNGLADLRLQSLASSGNKLFLGTSDNGVYQSTDNGITWADANYGMEFCGIKTLAVSGTNLLAGTDNNGVLVLSDNGTNWNKTGLQNTSIACLMIDGTNLLAGSGNNIFLSTNSGVNWTKINNGLAAYSIRVFSVHQGDYYVGTDNGVFQSTNNGNSWTSVSNGLPITPGLSRPSIHSLESIGTKLFAGTYSQGIFVSSDKGESWAPVNEVLRNTTVYKMTHTGNSLFAGADDCVLLSTNYGDSWARIDTGLSYYKFKCFLIYGTNLFLGTDKGLFFTADNGNNWTSINSGLPPGTKISSIAILGSYLFIGTEDNGVWKRSLTDFITSLNVSQTPEIPESFYLGQNFPNPFNPSTRINYTVPNLGFVNLKICDLLGNEVATIVNETVTAGSHSVEFNASKLPSGVYIYTLQEGQFRASRKFLLMK